MGTSAHDGHIDAVGYGRRLDMESASPSPAYHREKPPVTALAAEPAPAGEAGQFFRGELRPSAFAAATANAAKPDADTQADVGWEVVEVRIRIRFALSPGHRPLQGRASSPPWRQDVRSVRCQLGDRTPR